MTFKLPILIVVILLYWAPTLAQIPNIKTPTPANLTPKATIGFNNNHPSSTPNYHNNNGMTRTEINNQMIMKEVKYYEALRKRQEQLINEATEAVRKIKINYSFPINKNVEGASHYYSAFDEFEQMLSGKQPASVKRAVFLTENAYYENTVPYENYQKIIQNIGYICQAQMVKQRLPNSKLAKNLAIYQFFADTISLKQGSSEKTFTHYPLMYDFKDYRGDTIWENQFVNKLLMTQSGQCHSLPLLYLIVAEEIGTEAWLAYSPKHTYIKFKTGENSWQNFETTNGMLTSDAFVLQSGYIKAEALANRIYMDTLSKEQTIAHCLLDLAKGYSRKYGYDEFYLKCIETALEKHPKNIVGLMMKANYYNALWSYIRNQQLRIGGIPKSDVEMTKSIYLNAKNSYDYIKEIGYEEMPEQAYQKWLQSVNKEKSKTKYRTIQKSLTLIK